MISYRCYNCKKIQSINISDKKEIYNVKDNNPLLYQSLISVPNINELINKNMTNQKIENASIQFIDFKNSIFIIDNLKENNSELTNLVKNLEDEGYLFELSKDGWNYYKSLFYDKITDICTVEVNENIVKLKEPLDDKFIIHIYIDNVRKNIWKIIDEETSFIRKYIDYYVNQFNITDRRGRIYYGSIDEKYINSNLQIIDKTDKIHRRIKKEKENKEILEEKFKKLKNKVDELKVEYEHYVILFNEKDEELYSISEEIIHNTSYINNLEDSLNILTDQNVYQNLQVNKIQNMIKLLSKSDYIYWDNLNTALSEILNGLMIFEKRSFIKNNDKLLYIPGESSIYHEGELLPLHHEYTLTHEIFDELQKKLDEPQKFVKAMRLFVLRINNIIDYLDDNNNKKINIKLITLTNITHMDRLASLILLLGKIVIEFLKR